MTLTNHLVDVGQVLVGELGTECRNGLDVVVGLRAIIRGSRRVGGEQRSGIKTFHLERRSRVGRLPVGTQLTHHLDPNLGLNGDLVPDAHTFQLRWTLERAIVSDETSKEITNAL